MVAERGRDVDSRRVLEACTVWRLVISVERKVKMKGQGAAGHAREDVVIAALMDKNLFQSNTSISTRAQVGLFDTVAESHRGACDNALSRRWRVPFSSFRNRLSRRFHEEQVSESIVEHMLQCYHTSPRSHRQQIHTKKKGQEIPWKKSWK